MPLMFFIFQNLESHTMFTYYEKSYQGCIAAKGSNYRLTKCNAVHSVHYVTQTTVHSIMVIIIHHVHSEVLLAYSVCYFIALAKC